MFVADTFGVLQGDTLDSVALVESVEGPFLFVSSSTSTVRLGLVSIYTKEEKNRRRWWWCVVGVLILEANL